MLFCAPIADTVCTVGGLLNQLNSGSAAAAQVGCMLRWRRTCAAVLHPVGLSASDCVCAPTLLPLTCPLASCLAWRRLKRPRATNLLLTSPTPPPLCRARSRGERPTWRRRWTRFASASWTRCSRQGVLTHPSGLLWPPLPDWLLRLLQPCGRDHNCGGGGDGPTHK